MGGVARTAAAAGVVLFIASVSTAQNRGDIAIGSGDGDHLSGALQDSGWKTSEEAEEYHLDVACTVDSATATVTAPDNKEDMEIQFWNEGGQNQSVAIDWDNQEDGSGGSGGDYLSVNCGSEYGPCNHPRDTQQTLNSLYPFQQYTFCLKNVSSQDPIICKECKTKDAVPLSNPSVLPVESGLDFVTARWKQLDDELIGGPDLKYKVQLESSIDNKPLEKITNGTSITFSNLAPGSNFTVSVSAQNRVGESKAEKQSSHVSTQELVAPQVNQVREEWRNHSLASTVAWQLGPSLANLCGDNCTTAIQLWQPNGEEFLQLGHQNVTREVNKTFELPDGFGPWIGLTRDTHFTLKTLYSSFSSSATQHARLFAPVTAPLVQPNVTRIALGHTYIHISWNQLSREQQGGPGIFYETKLINLEENVEKIEDRTINTSYSFTSLAPGTKYSFFVSSGNELGMSIAGFAGRQVTTKQLLPPHTLAVTHEWTNSTVVATVTWHNHRNVTQWPNTTVQLWTPNNQQKTLLHQYQIHNQTEMKFHLTGKINEETLLTLKTSIGQYESNETEAVKLFDGVTVPLANPNVSIAEVGLTSMKVEWSPLPRRLHGAPGINYTVRCDQCKHEYKEFFSSNTSLTLNHLTPGREYNISVTAENMIGQSNGPLYSRIVKTKELLAPSHVTVSKEWVNQSLVAVIRWQSPQKDKRVKRSGTDQKLDDDIQGLFRTHIHLWNMENGQKILIDNQTLLPDQTEKRFILTAELANVFFSLKSFYREHQSNETELMKLFDGVSVPSVQPKVSIGNIGPTFILIQWPQFPREQWGAPGLLFKVKCNGSAKNFEVLTSNNSQLISDLIPGEEYSISVTSENILGESDEAAIAKRFKTTSLMPPIDIMVEQGEDDTILVSWMTSHNVSTGCKEVGVYLDLWNQHQGDYSIVESHQVDSSQLGMELRVEGDLDYGTMLSMKSYCDHYNSSRSQRLSLIDAPDLEPPINITVSHIWNNNILTANIDWQFPENENIQKNVNKGGVILELWSTNGTHYSPVNNYTFSYNQTQLSFNLSEELNQRAMFRMMTYYQNHQSTATNLTELFYDVSQEASSALLERVSLISGLSILVFAVLSLLACHLFTSKKKRSYNTNSVVGYENCNNTQLRSFTAADQTKGATPVKETSDGGYGSLRGSLGSVSVEGDDMWFLYSGMDEDGSFIVSYSHIQDTDTDNLEWREASAGEQPLL